jgi:hypothetical protein
LLEIFFGSPEMERCDFFRNRSIRRSKPKARAATIARLIETLQAKTGRMPSDAELAGLLACSPGKIRQHRNTIA